jgi:hypothetical protein
MLIRIINYLVNYVLCSIGSLSKLQGILDVWFNRGFIEVSRIQVFFNRLFICRIFGYWCFQRRTCFLICESAASDQYLFNEYLSCSHSSLCHFRKCSVIMYLFRKIFFHLLHFLCSMICTESLCRTTEARVTKDSSHKSHEYYLTFSELLASEVDFFETALLRDFFRLGGVSFFITHAVGLRDRSISSDSELELVSVMSGSGRFWPMYMGKSSISTS